jgi:hypothetical protein
MRTLVARVGSVLLCGSGALLGAGCFRPPGQVAVPPAPLVAAARGEEAPPVRDNAPAPAAAEGFPFPDDQGGKLLADLLTPAGKGGLAKETARQRTFATPGGLDDPSPPLPAAPGNLPARPAGKKGPGLKPADAPEVSPLATYQATPDRPAAVTFAPGELVRTPAPPYRPASLPPLGQPVLDRAPLDDPTADLSLEAVLAAQMPARTNAVPFTRNNLPDPFENRAVVKVRTPPAEEGTPVVPGPKTPKP